MGFFHWTKDGDSETVSPYVWIYVIVTMTLTFLTLAVFYACISSRGLGARSGKDYFMV